MAMVAVGGMLASAVIKVVIGQIYSTIGGEIKLHKNTKKDLEHMKMTLESVEAVLGDAETRSVTDKSALLWLKQLKDAMYDISGMLDDFEAHTDLVTYEVLEEMLATLVSSDTKGQASCYIFWQD